MRPIRILAALLFAAAIGTPTLLAAPAWAASSTPPVAVQVSPTPVVAGHTVTLSGSVGPEAAGSDCSAIILYSDGFAPTNRKGDLTPVYATAKPSGAFSATTTIPRSKLAGSYTIHLRCGGASLGGGTLVVRALPTPPPAKVHVSPSSVAAGDSVTLSGSVGDPESVAGSECATGVKLLSRAFESTQEFADWPALGVAVRPDGTFTTTTTIPRSRAAGTYPITGRCGGGNFGGATLEVRAAPPTTPTTTSEPMSPTPEDPPTDPPADPPVTQPQVPAPMVPGPATQPTDHLASRWVIPGLAALAGGTLAALGVWLLYWRRHPAHPSRQGRSYLAP
jgi:hypothetical protein